MELRENSDWKIDSVLNGSSFPVKNIKNISKLSRKYSESIQQKEITDFIQKARVNEAILNPFDSYTVFSALGGDSANIVSSL